MVTDQCGWIVSPLGAWTSCMLRNMEKIIRFLKKGLLSLKKRDYGLHYLETYNQNRFSCSHTPIGSWDWFLVHHSKQRTQCHCNGVWFWIPIVFTTSPETPLLLQAAKHVFREWLSQRGSENELEAKLSHVSHPSRIMLTWILPLPKITASADLPKLLMDMLNIQFLLYILNFLWAWILIQMACLLQKRPARSLLFQYYGPLSAAVCDLCPSPLFFSINGQLELLPHNAAESSQIAHFLWHLNLFIFVDNVKTSESTC